MLVGENMACYTRRRGEGVERGDAASKLENDGSAGEEMRRKEKVCWRGEPICKRGCYFPKDWGFFFFVFSYFLLG